MKKSNSIVIGGGFFGSYLANYLAELGEKVVLVERENDLLQRASYSNQARVHNGYHYPRNILTGLRSRVSFPRFVSDFPEAISKSFEKYYLIARTASKITPTQFKLYCDRIGAFYEPAPSKVQRLLNPNLVAECFRTVEYAFNAKILKELMIARLSKSGVTVVNNSEAIAVKSIKNANHLEVTVQAASTRFELEADNVYNCTYSQINTLNRNSSLSFIPLKHEITEMCLVEMPQELQNIAMTVMCGPFFSFMPFPARENTYTFSHVRYTPHIEWLESEETSSQGHLKLISDYKKISSWKYMKSDATRYIPVLNDCKYVDSLWEVKTILPSSEISDSRPILFKPHHGLHGYHCIMGGKIDNIYDAVAVVDEVRSGFNEQ